LAISVCRLAERWTAFVVTQTKSPDVVEDRATCARGERIWVVRRGDNPSKIPNVSAPRKKRRLEMLKAITAAGAVAVASALLLPTASLASTASAAGDEATQTARVSYADLDLANPAGSNALQSRIKVAAAGLCGAGTARPVELSDIKANKECVTGAIASAQPAFNQAVAAARGGSVTVSGATLIVAAPIQ
jgi:UrcA family protein